MTRRLLALAVSAALACGCVSPQRQVQRRASITPLPSLPSRDLRLGLVVTDKTKDSLNRLVETLRKSQQGSLSDATKPFDRINEVLRAGFYSVDVADNADQAKAGGADLIGVLDLDAVKLRAESAARFGLLGILTMGLSWVFTPDDVVDLHVSLALTTPDLAPIETLQWAVRKGGVRQFQSWPPRDDSGLLMFDTWLAEGAEDLAAELQGKLAASTALAAFAQRRAKAPRPALAAASRVPEAEVETPPFRFDEDPNDYAVVIGVEKYAVLPEARFAERDAQSIRARLLALGYPERNIASLTGERASRAGIQKLIESWLPDNVNEESRVFVYFAGQGAPDPKTHQAYLVPWDGDPSYLENTGYSVKRLYEKLDSLRAKEIVLVMDSGFSGAGGRSVIAQGTRPLISKIDTGLESSRNLVVLSAAGPDETSGVDEARSHGLLTYFLLKAIDESKGADTVGQLYASLSPRVRDAARQDNRGQTPRLLPSGSAAPASLKLR